MATAVVSCTGKSGLLKGLKDGQGEGDGFCVTMDMCRYTGLLVGFGTSVA